jgi:hypothetical protein
VKPAATTRAVPEVVPKMRSKQPQVQTLLRVTYDMPADKAKALAAFLKENVQQYIDLHVSEQAGLIITADAETQAPIAAMVSLMTGERVVLDWGQYAKPAAYPMTPYGNPSSYGPPTMEGYLPPSSFGSRRGIFPPRATAEESTKPGEPTKKSLPLDGRGATTKEYPGQSDARRPETLHGETTKELPPPLPTSPKEPPGKTPSVKEGPTVEPTRP